MTNNNKWHELRTKISIIGKHWIDGKYVDATTGATIDKLSSTDGKHLVSFARGDCVDIDKAVTAADRTFNTGVWANLAPSARKAKLLKVAELIDKYKEELALLETIDVGKPIADSLNSDVAEAKNTFQYYAELIDKVYGEIAPTSKELFYYVTKEPVGVVGVIVPWNYPLLMTSWKLAPALAAGNSVVIKPSERSPLTALKLAEIIKEAGIPDGVVNVVLGYGHEAGEALALHPKVRAIGFTGSTAVGAKMFAYSSQSNLKRVYNELGGKSPVIVFNDYDNLEQVAKAITGSMFYNQGQSCNAPSRILVQDDIADKLVQHMIACAKEYIPADPLLEETTLGAVVDEKHLQRVLTYIDSGIKNGASCVHGGKRFSNATGGFYVEPTIFDNVTQQMQIAKEEIFGPVLSIIRFKTEAEAIAIANDTEYGLSSGIWSNNINRIHRVIPQLRAGTVCVNEYSVGNLSVPFGGYKQSGNGRDKSIHALDKYVELKTVCIRLT
jgi:acyl-CoA reductase-like NAD-dependent aldehyde dehydrogenase